MKLGGRVQKWGEEQPIIQQQQSATETVRGERTTKKEEASAPSFFLLTFPLTTHSAPLASAGAGAFPSPLVAYHKEDYQSEDYG